MSIAVEMCSEWVKARVGHCLPGEQLDGLESGLAEEKRGREGMEVLHLRKFSSSESQG